MNATPASLPHLPVLYHEIIEALSPKASGKYIDATVGAGGHADGILKESKPDGLLLGLDLDPQALVIASQRLSVYKSRVILRQASHTGITKEAESLGWNSVDGIIMDLGVSSMQLDTPERGFSFRKEGPLDMRFGPVSKSSAAELINSLPESELAKILWEFGEERYSRRIARLICDNRPIQTTTELAKIIERAYGKYKGHLHPATRTFQAIRIAVNQELAAVKTTIPQAINLLNPGGRLAVITFHSLEDRIVKQIFRLESKDCICPPQQPVCTCGHKATIKEVNRKPIEPQPEETQDNPRARSAKLRIVEKITLA
jgi:16S rRNA (cytosine1402-N4)-methyltransferase